MIVVFDTNVFHGDVHADRSQLRAILDGAVGEGTMELYVPEVVLLELDKQFGQRSKRVVRDVNKAVGEYHNELRKLGLDAPPPLVAEADTVAGYRAALEQRLAQVGAKILPVPDDLSPALAWAVHRRKPFKDSGEGFQDAVIWLSVLGLLGAQDEEIVFVTSNTKDFGEGGRGLADVLRDDVEAAGKGRNQVRLAPGIAAFYEEFVRKFQSAPAIATAKELVASGALENTIVDALAYTHLDKEPLNLGVELEADPLITGVGFDELSIYSATELPGDQLLIECVTTAEFLLDLVIEKSAYYVDEGELPHVTVTDPDFNDWYLEAQAEVIIDLKLEITTDRDGHEAQVVVVDFRLAPLEIVHNALRGADRKALEAQLRDSIDGTEVDVYAAEDAIESDIDQAVVSAVQHDPVVTLTELVDTDDEVQTCLLRVEIAADVEWIVNAPSPFDAEVFRGLAQDAEADAPVLVANDFNVELVCDVTAEWDPENGWHDLVVDRVELNEAELKRRRDRPTAAEEAHMDLRDDPGH